LVAGEPEIGAYPDCVNGQPGRVSAKTGVIGQPGYDGRREASLVLSTQESDGLTEHLLLVARLKPDAVERARELASGDAPPDPVLEGLRFSTFLSPTEVVFVIEGAGAEAKLREWFNDPARSSAISPWLPLFDGPLHAAREVA
jgi:hypothetical protein